MSSSTLLSDGLPYVVVHGLLVDAGYCGHLAVGATLLLQEKYLLHLAHSLCLSCHGRVLYVRFDSTYNIHGKSGKVNGLSLRKERIRNLPP